jgi:acetyl esterase
MKLDDQSQMIIDGLNRSGVVPFSRFTPAEARNEILKLRVERPAIPTHEMSSVAEEFVTTPDGSFKVRILTPRHPQPGELMPAVIYYHGGGFFAGGLDETDLIVRQIAKQADVVVFNVDYHLSPEAKFPVAVNDAYATLEWVAANAGRFYVDPKRLMLAGDSAGGNLVIVTSLIARDAGGPGIRLQVPIYPSLDLRVSASYESRQRWGGGDYFLINDDIQWMLASYYKNPADGEDWRASPILAPTYAGLPPALIVTASHDPLVDEGNLYAKRLKADGVETEYACFDGTFHGFVSFAMFLDTGKRAMDLICNRINQAGWR